MARKKNASLKYATGIKSGTHIDYKLGRLKYQDLKDGESQHIISSHAFGELFGVGHVSQTNTGFVTVHYLNGDLKQAMCPDIDINDVAILKIADLVASRNKRKRRPEARKLIKELEKA